MAFDDEDEIVEMLENGEWVKTTIRNVNFLRKVFDFDIDSRRIEGSLDGGVTWKIMYDSQVQLFGKVVWDTIRWRVKE